MTNIQWNDTTYGLIHRTPVWKHIQELEKHMSNCIQRQDLLSNEPKLNFVIEVVGFQETQSVMNGIHWIRANLFLIDNPDHTFTILTLRCNNMSEFPVILDVNYSEESELVHFDDTKTFRFVLEKECIYGLRKVSHALSNYIFQTNTNLSTTPDNSVLFDEQERVKKLKNWTDEENQIFIHIINEYRQDIANLGAFAVKEITRNFAFRLKKHFELLEERSERAIYEHLAYFDDLLAGAGELTDYAKKDGKYFGTHSRHNGNKQFNLARIFRRQKRY